MITIRPSPYTLMLSFETYVCLYIYPIADALSATVPLQNELCDRRVHCNRHLWLVPSGSDGEKAAQNYSVPA